MGNPFNGPQPGTVAEDTAVMTTVMITGDPTWSCMKLPSHDGEQLLLQDNDLNLAIMGTMQQLTAMVGRMGNALNNVIDETVIRRVIKP